MKLAEALRAANAPPAENAAAFDVSLVCGFEPAHLKTFLVAHLRGLLPDARVTIEPGLFGSLLASLGRSLDAPFAARVVVVEWSDLDPRLGIRDLGGWHPDDLGDIVQTAGDTLRGLVELLRRAGPLAPVALATPTLPLPPLWFTPPSLAGPFETELRAAVARFAADAAAIDGVRLVSGQRIDLRSPLQLRRDVKTELAYGHPYTVAHDDTLAELLATAVVGARPKKGLITDLDDTMWRGLVGEIGADAISWHLDAHSQVHGLYQQTLSSLAASGTLIAIASKNDPAVVDEALARTDLLLAPDRIFPIEVSWNPKSAAVARILRAWNIGPDSVVFVDDNPLELAEVQAAFPDIEVLQFPASDDAAALALCERLRELFARDRVSEEDRLRLDSLRASAELAPLTTADAATADSFLAAARAKVTVTLNRAAPDPRALELVNKTNQFNLNGRRHTEQQWQAELSEPGAFLAVVSYEDKFGALGKIAVMRGVRDGERAAVDTWVMSCRAFSRRIEFQSLDVLFRELEVEEIDLDFSRTARNGPVEEFLEVVSGSAPGSPVTVTKEQFRASCPELFHELTVVRE